jgi:hypothetical protein
VTGINIDMTPPTAVLSVKTGTTGTNGWYTSDVTVQTTGSDTLSGPVSCTADQFQATETTGTIFHGSCTNLAGLSTDAAPLTVKLDKTGPSATLAVTAGTLGLDGWYTSDVTVHASGSDAISDNVVCTADQHQTTETAGHIFNGQCTNDAGLSTNATSLTIKLDKTGPSAALSITAGTLGSNGWYTSDVTIHASGTDAISDSVTCTADQSQTTETTGTVFNGACTNDAGLSTNAAPLTVKLDKTGPSASLSVTAGTAGVNGWYISDVTVHTSGTDAISDSVVCTADQHQTAETTGAVFNGACTNNAGLSTNAAPITVKLDKTGPSATLAVTAGTLGSGGWYTSDVTVSTSGVDSISDNVVCTADQHQTSETTGTVFHSTCTNDAGLSTNAAPLTVKLDKTGPSAALSVTAGTLGLNGWYTSDVTVHTSGSDAVSDSVVCTADQYQTSETSSTGVDFHGSCTNGAGLSTDASTLTIKLDSTAPVISWNTPAADTYFKNGDSISVAATVTESGSGITVGADCNFDSTGGMTFSGTVNYVQAQGKCIGDITITNGGGDGARQLSLSLTDLAGNTGGSDHRKIYIDSTAPATTIALNPTTPNGNNNWYKTNVHLTISAIESGGSGLAETRCVLDPVSEPTTFDDMAVGCAYIGAGADVTTEGQHIIYTASKDNVGNKETLKNQSFKIDKTGPSAVLSVKSGTLGSNNWYTSDVVVGTTGTDPISDSVTCTLDQSFTSETTGVTVNGHCTNGAGLSTDAAPINVKIDKTGPSASLSVTAGTAGANGWYTSDVTVHASGTDSISGPVSCTADQFQTTETAGQVFNGQCTNDAGLSTDATPITIKLDKTGPSANLAVTAGTAGANGWYTSDVTVSTSGTDAISDSVVCTADQYQTTDTAGADFNGDCTNDAGLKTDATPLNVKLDKIAPVISVTGTNPIEIEVYSSYTDAGATVIDNLDSTVVVTSSGSVDTDLVGDYTIYYDSVDAAGNHAVQKSRSVHVVDTTKPVITLLGSTPVTIEVHSTYTDDGATALDNYDGDLTSSIVTVNSVDKDVIGTYTVTYDVTDANHNAADQVVRTVNVVDTTPPVITLNGDDPLTIEVHHDYVELGAVVTDNYDTGLTATITGTVDKDTVGTYTVYYDATDSSSNAAIQVTRTVHVVDTTPPVIAAHDDVTEEATSAAGAIVTYTSPTATDNYDTSVSVSCTPVSGSAFPITTTEVTCSAVDAAGNHAADTTFNVIVQDTTAPVISGAPTTSANANNWYNADVTVHFTCTDSGSGVASVTPDTTLSTSAAGQHVLGTCTDVAGNSATFDVTGINIDKTAPTDVILTPSGTAGTNGWYTSDVTISTSGTDSISGPVSCTADQFQTDETAGTVFHGSCTNLAGLSTDAAPLTVKLDKTGPSANLAVTAGTLGSNGWYTSDVTISTSGTDSISSPVTCTSDQYQMVETTGQPFNGQCTNDAGLSTDASSLTIKLDKTAPSANLAVTAGTLGSNGWYTSDVTVSTSGTDSISGPVVCTVDQSQTTETTGNDFSGACTNDAGLKTDASPLNVKLDKTGPSAALSVKSGTLGANDWYISDVIVSTNGEDSVSNPVTCDSDQTFGETKAVTVNGVCTNDAGLSTKATPMDLKIDETVPSITGSRTPVANEDGWNKEDVTVKFDCSDKTSDVDSLTPDETIKTEGKDQSRTGSCTDLAGNSNRATVSDINIDKTAPTIEGSRTPEANTYGWNNVDVTAKFTCDDALSGVKDCTEDTVVSTEGENQKVTGTVTDKAGNSATYDVIGISIDKTKPSTTDDFTNDGVWVNYDQSIKLTPSDADPSSGIEYTKYCTDPKGTCEPTDEYTTNTPITFTTDGETYLRYVSKDKAGNEESVKQKVVKIDETAPTASIIVSGVSGSTCNFWLQWWIDSGSISYDVVHGCAVISADIDSSVSGLKSYTLTLYNSQNQIVGQSANGKIDFNFETADTTYRIVLEGYDNAGNYFTAVKDTYEDDDNDYGILKGSGGAPDLFDLCPSQVPSLDLNHDGCQDIQGTSIASINWCIDTYTGSASTSVYPTTSLTQIGSSFNQGSKVWYNMVSSIASDVGATFAMNIVDKQGQYKDEIHCSIDTSSIKTSSATFSIIKKDNEKFVYKDIKGTLRVKEGYHNLELSDGTKIQATMKYNDNKDSTKLQLVYDNDQKNKVCNDAANAAKDACKTTCGKDKQCQKTCDDNLKTAKDACRDKNHYQISKDYSGLRTLSVYDILKLTGYEA